jgi:hypothetical protein
MMDAMLDPRVVTAIRQVTTLPRVAGAVKTSAKMPDETDIGAEAPKPAKNRKTRRAFQLGAMAEAAAKTSMRETPPLNAYRRPNISPSGANRNGPTEHPIKYMDTISVPRDAVVLNFVVIVSWAPTAIELPKVAVNAVKKAATAAAHGYMVLLPN